MLKQLTFAGRLVNALIALLILAACTSIAPPQEQINNTTNETIGVQLGDLVTINYELYFENGTLADTNNPELLPTLNGSDYVRGFAKGPYTFVLGQSGKVQGFDEAILGMQNGETKESIIEPSHPEITLSINNTQSHRRQITIPRLQSFPISSYDRIFGKRPVKGDIVQNKTLQFRYQIVNITDKYAIGKILAKEGEEYTLQNTYWPSQIIKIAEEDILFFQEPKDNQTVPSPFGTAIITVQGSLFNITFQPELGMVFNYTSAIGQQSGITEPYRVTEVNDDNFVIKRYGLLSDKRLTLKATMIEHTPDVKKVKDNDKKLIQQIVDGKEI